MTHLRVGVTTQMGFGSLRECKGCINAGRGNQENRCTRLLGEGGREGEECADWGSSYADRSLCMQKQHGAGGMGHVWAQARSRPPVDDSMNSTLCDAALQHNLSSHDMGCVQAASFTTCSSTAAMQRMVLPDT